MVLGPERLFVPDEQAVEVLKLVDGTRSLLVPNVKRAQTMDFAQFLKAYNEVVRKARGGSLEIADFEGTTISLTNPGTIGTIASVPRLMQSQGTIIATGQIDYPAEYSASDPPRPTMRTRLIRPPSIRLNAWVRRE